MEHIPGFPFVDCPRFYQEESTVQNAHEFSITNECETLGAGPGQARMPTRCGWIPGRIQPEPHMHVRRKNA